MKRTTLLLLLTARLFTAGAQDIGFSQLFETPILRNPSLSGLFDGDWRFGAQYRTQWNSLTVPYVSKTASAMLKFAAGPQSNGFWSFGAQFVTDKAGDLSLTRNQFLLAPAYHLYIGGTGNTYLSASMMFGTIRSYFNTQEAQLDDQFVGGSFSPVNPTMQPFNNTNYSYMDWSAGLTLSGQAGEGDFYLGAALFHANWIAQKTIDVFQPIKHKWVLNGGLTIPITDGIRGIGYADYAWQTGNNQLFFGGLIDFVLSEQLEDMSETRLSLGAFFRLKDAAIPYIKLQWQRLSIGFSFDKTISHLNSAAALSNSMELSLSYTGIFSNDRSSLQRSKCPRFGGRTLGWFSTR